MSFSGCSENSVDIVGGLGDRVPTPAEEALKIVDSYYSDWQSHIPDKIIHSIAEGNKNYKCRMAWFSVVMIALEMIRDDHCEGKLKLSNESVKLIDEFKDYMFYGDFRMRSLNAYYDNIIFKTTPEDIAKADEVLLAVKKDLENQVELDRQHIDRIRSAIASKHDDIKNA